MTTQSNTPGTPSPEAFWKPRHALIGLGVLAVLVMLMMRACGEDEDVNEANAVQEKPRQAIAVQIPASQWPSAQQQAQQALPQVQQQYGYAPQQQLQPMAPQPQPTYGYAPQQVQPQQVQPQPQAPAAAAGNPWAVQQQPYSYGRPQSQQWGTAQPTRPQYVQPSTQSQYRPLEQPAVPVQPQQPAPQQQPVIVYRPSAPYDRRSGSSFGTSVYPYGYGGGYPGHYGAPGAYAPGWSGGSPGYPPGAYPGIW